MTKTADEAPLRYFVHHHLVGDAAQRGVLLDGPDRLSLQNGGDCRRIDHRCRDVNLLRGRQALDARSDIDGLSEIILPLIEHHGETRPLVNTDLDNEILAAALR